VPSSSEGGIIRDIREIVAERTAGAFGEEWLHLTSWPPTDPSNGASATASRAPSTAAPPELTTVSHAELEALAPMLEDDVLGQRSADEEVTDVAIHIFFGPSTSWAAS
jgi:hypothetical protein